MTRQAIWMAALGFGAAAQAASLRVQVQEGQVRRAPSFLGGVVATVGYGQSVEVVRTQGAWHEVRTPAGASGWLHASALTAKRVAAPATGGTARTGATGDEMALAGKGFNKSVEEQFKASHADADFTWVDRMAALRVSDDERLRFVKEGGLKLPGGAE